MRVVLDLLDELTNTRIFGFVTTECGNPYTLKSISTSLNVEDEPIGCPITTGLTVLSWSASSSKLVFWQSRKKRASISWALEQDVFSITTGLPVLSWFGFGFGWVGWEPSACRAAPEPNSFIQSCFKENLWRLSRWFIYFFVRNFFSFHPNNFRDTISWECIVKTDGVRSRPRELQSFPQSKIDVDPTHCVLMSLPCFMHVLCKTRCSQVYRLRILVVLIHRFHKQKEYCLSFAQFFDLPVSSLNRWWNANWSHLQRDKCTWRNRPESRHCPVMKDQWDCVLNDLEKLGSTRLLLMNQYNTGIFSCFLLLLPSFSSTFRQTHDDNTQNDPEKNLLFSRIQSLHHLLEVDNHDEEDWSVSSYQNSLQ